MQAWGLVKTFRAVRRAADPEATRAAASALGQALVAIERARLDDEMGRRANWNAARKEFARAQERVARLQVPSRRF
jgi:hypothetical protein